MSSIFQRIQKSFQALQSRFHAQRDVPPKIRRRQIDEEIPFSWQKDEVLWGYVTNKYGIKGSGAGFVSSSYTAYWDRIWGATPIEDLGKYKDLYTFTPYIKASIDVTVNLAVNGFEFVVAHQPFQTVWKVSFHMIAVYR